MTGDILLVTSHRLIGSPKWPELCIKTVIRLCTCISQNHPCILTLPFWTGRMCQCGDNVKVSLLVWRTRYTDTFCDAVDCRFELALEVQRWTMGPVANVCRGPKNYIVMPLVSAFKANTRISENVSIVHGNSVRDTPSSRKISFWQKGREWTWSGYRARIFQVADRNPASNMQ